MIMFNIQKGYKTSFAQPQFRVFFQMGKMEISTFGLQKPTNPLNHSTAGSCERNPTHTHVYSTSMSDAPFSFISAKHQQTHAYIRHKGTWTTPTRPHNRQSHTHIPHFTPLASLHPPFFSPSPLFLVSLCTVTFDRLFV